MAITIITPAQDATINVASATNFKFTVTGTCTGTIKRVDVQARIPDAGIYGPIANATTTNQYGNWTALLTVPDTRYTRILARKYNLLNKVAEQSFNGVYYNVTTQPPPISPLLSPTVTGCPTVTVSSYTVTVSAGSSEATIQNAIIAASNQTGGGKVHLNAGEYSISSGLDMYSNVILEGADRATTKLKCVQSGIKVLSSGSKSNIMIQNLAIDGANISNKVLNFDGNTNLIIRHCILERHLCAVGPGVYLGDCTNATIFNNISRNHAAKGDKMAVGGTNIRVLTNELYGTVTENGSITSGGMIGGEVAYNYIHDTISYAGTSFENQSFKTYNVDIHHNTYKRITDGNAVLFVTPVTADAIASHTFDKIFVHDNTMEDIYDGSGVQTRQGRNVTNLKIYNNSMTNCNFDAIRVGPVLTCDIYDNIITRPYPYAIRLLAPSDTVHMGVWGSNQGDNTITPGVATKADGSIRGTTKSPPYYYTGSTNVWIDSVKKA